MWGKVLVCMCIYLYISVADVCVFICVFICVLVLEYRYLYDDVLVRMCKYV